MLPAVFSNDFWLPTLSAEKKFIFSLNKKTNNVSFLASSVARVFCSGKFIRLRHTVERSCKFYGILTAPAA